jgi:hypothetical protein
MTTRSSCSKYALACLLVVSALMRTGAAPAGAAVTKVEAESIGQPGSCWSPLSYQMLSNGAGRTCYSAGAPLVWTVSVPTGEQGVIGLYAYRDQVSRGFRVRVDGAAWSQGTLSGSFSPSALFFTSPSLPTGSHRVELEWVNSAGALTFDFYQVETTPLPTTTSTTAPPPTATSTTAPPVATAPPSTGPPGPALCKVAPGDGQGAIAAAIKGCPNGSTVLFPANQTYHQTDKIVVTGRKDLVIDGNGSTFVKTSPSDGNTARPNWQLVENRRVTLQNMTVRGAFTNPTSPRNPTLVTGPNQFDSAVFIYGGDGTTVRDVSAFNVFGEFVTTAPSGFVRGGGALDGEVPRSVRVERLHGEHAARQCVAPTAAYGFWLVDSSLSDCQQNAVDAEIDVPGEPLRDVHITGNTISGYYFSAIAVPVAGRTGDVDGVEIRGNKILTGSDTCFPSVLANYPESPVASVANVVTEDNDMKTLGTGVSYRSVSSGSVRNNRIEKTAPDSLCGPPSPRPVVQNDSPNVAVAGNTAVGYT